MLLRLAGFLTYAERGKPSRPQAVAFVEFLLL